MTAPRFRSKNQEDLADEWFEYMSEAETEEERDDIFEEYFYQSSMLDEPDEDEDEY